MGLVRLLIKFWFFIVASCFGGFVLIFNREPIYVNLPGIGEFKVWAAVAFIVAFLLGATLVTLYFMMDVLKKSYELRKSQKRIRDLENQIGRGSGSARLDPSPAPEAIDRI